MEFFAVTHVEAIASLARLARQIWLSHYPAIIGSAQTEYMLEHYHSEAIIQRQIETGELDYFLFGQRQGYLAFGVQGRDCLLSKLYVHPADQGRGLGRKALDFVAHQAKNHGCSAIVLGVNRHNFQALDAYLSWGFAVEKTQVMDIGQGYVMDDYWLRLALT
jgi:ribosomal protein S18 acetylase RimI-like enzyme